MPLINENIEAADHLLVDASNLLRALTRLMERYDPKEDGDDLSDTEMWTRAHVASEKVAEASELINPSEVPSDEVRSVFVNECAEIIGGSDE